MKKSLIILSLILSSLQSYSQVTWVSHNDSLFMKRGGDSVYYNQYMFFDFIVSMKNTLGIAQGILNTKQDDLVSGTNIKTVNGSTILGSGDLVVAGSAAFSSITGQPTDNANLTTALNLKANLASPTFTGTVTLPNNAVNNAMLAGSIDASTKLINVLPYSSGGISASAATSATTGVMTVNMTSSMITITPTGACTFNASGGVTGQRVTFLITTSGTTSFVLTFGTNFRKVGTLATGTTSARFFSVTFICLNGTTWQEIARTAAQT